MCELQLQLHHVKRFESSVSPLETIVLVLVAATQLWGNDEFFFSHLGPGLSKNATCGTSFLN